MGRIFVTSDLHFGHSKEFLFVPRGFRSIQEHDEALIANWNKVVTDDDDVYVLGDLTLGDYMHGIDCVRRLKGRIHLVRGNHDTDMRWNEVYPTIPNIVEFCGWATGFKYRGYHFYLAHFPTFTANLEKESLKQCTICLYGHTHQRTNFFQDMPFMYHVGVDSHHNTPVLLDDAIEDMKQQVEECKSLL